MRNYCEESNYWSDSRVRAAFGTTKFQKVDPKTLTGVFVCENDEGEEEELPVKLMREKCDLCDGTGRVVNPSIDCDGLTSEDFDEDPDFREDYFSGVYDIPCTKCKGERIVIELDRDETKPEVLKVIDAWEKEENDYRRTVAAERAMGA